MFVRNWKIEALYREIDMMWEEIADQAALIEYLFEARFLAEKKAPKATKKVASTSRTKKV